MIVRYPEIQLLINVISTFPYNGIKLIKSGHYFVPVHHDSQTAY